jgi:hypothetical protein
VFLERHFETLQRTSESPSRPGTGALASSTMPSVMGPLGVSTTAINLTNMGTDRDLDTDDITGRLAKLGRVKVSTRACFYGKAKPIDAMDLNSMAF